MRGLPGVTLVDARGADDCEPAQHLPRGGAEGGHREAAHDARLRAREPTLLALEAELTVVLVGDALGDVLGKPQEPVVKLAKVPEHERVGFLMQQSFTQATKSTYIHDTHDWPDSQKWGIKVLVIRILHGH